MGDRPLDESLRTVILAAREAMVNAAKSSGAASGAVFYEVEPERVTVYVRDRGAGFDPAVVPHDRYGIRESLVGRMARAGGTAVLRSAQGEGTEVALALPLRPGGGGT